MSALKYAKQILSEVTAYQHAKKNLAQILYKVKYYENQVKHTRSEKKKAIISAHLSRLHEKAAHYKQKLDEKKHKINSDVHKMLGTL